jgi:hypothetical protein
MKLSGAIATLGLIMLCSAQVVAANGHRQLARLRVSVFNSAPISAETIERAEGEASRVLRDAGVEIIWLNCPQRKEQEAALGRCVEAQFPFHLHLTIVRASRGLKVSTVGIAFSGEDGRGCYADLFHDVIQQLQEETHVPAAAILGHAMAHELGHLLLGTSSHTPIGLMRAHWDREDLIQAAKGNLRFSHDQSLRILRRLAQEGPIDSLNQ